MTNRILVVDDDPVVLRSLSRLLQRWDWPVSTCDSAKQALEVLQVTPYAVLLADYRMPDMDGVTFLREAHKVQPLAIKLILSGDANYESVLDSISDRIVSRFIRKPWQNHVLKQELLQALNQFRLNSGLPVNVGLANLSTSETLSIYNIHTFDFVKLWRNVVQNKWHCTALFALTFIRPQSSIHSIGLAYLLQQQHGQSAANYHLIELSPQEYVILVTDTESTEQARQIGEGVLAQCLCYSQRHNIGELVLTGGKLTGAPTSFTQALINVTAISTQSNASAINTLNWDQTTDDSNTIALTQALHDAIEAESFKLVFQPKIRASDRKIIGAECLLRWQHQIFGNISPNVFIPLAEERADICKIGRWVLSQALAYLSQWKHSVSASTMQLAINMSPLQFNDPQFLTTLKQTLSEQRIPGKLLRIEITETAAVDDMEQCKNYLLQLVELGIEVAIDDFGTGNTTISYLTELPAQVVKLDRSLITRVEHCDKQRKVVTGLIAMAHSLGIKVVSEGVESMAQLNQLRHSKCDELQGFLFSKPVSHDELLRLFAEQPFQKRFEHALF